MRYNICHWLMRSGWEVMNLTWNHNPLNSKPQTRPDQNLKQLAIITYDNRGVLLRDFIAVRKTVNVKCYAQFLMTKLRRKKRPVRLNAFVLLIHYNATLHKSSKTVIDRIYFWYKSLKLQLVIKSKNATTGSKILRSRQSQNCHGRTISWRIVYLICPYQS